MSIANDLSFIIHIEGKLFLSLKDSHLVKNKKKILMHVHSLTYLLAFFKAHSFNISKSRRLQYEVTTGKILFLVKQYY